MKALVTGGGGFVGLYIVEQLLADGHDVRVFCRGKYAALDALKVETVQGDIRDASAVESACQGVEAVFHTAAVPGIWGAWKTFYSINTVGTRHVIAGCARHRVARLIYTSSPSVVFDGNDHHDADESLPYPNRWLCHYPHSKALAEQEVLAANGLNGMRTIALRPHLIWGPRDNHLFPRLIARAKAGRLRRVGDGNNLVSVAYVENVAAAHLQAESALRESSVAAGKPYFVNDEVPVNLWDWVNRLLSLISLGPVRRSISRQAAYRIGAACELIYGCLRLPQEPPMTRFVASQLAGTHYYSIAAAKRDFGYCPIMDVEEGARRLMAGKVTDTAH